MLLVTDLYLFVIWGRIFISYKWTFKYKVFNRQYHFYCFKEELIFTTHQL